LQCHDVFVELTDFLLARFADEELSWSEARSARPDLAQFTSRMIAQCEAKRAKVGTYRRRPSPQALRELQSLALPDYDPPDNRDEWRNPTHLGGSLIERAAERRSATPTPSKQRGAQR
jgi:hypothetical protein